MPVDIIEGHYNLSHIINSSSLGNMASDISPLLGGYYLGWAFLLIIFSVTFLFLLGQGRRARSCVLAGLTITMVASWFLFVMNMIDPYTLFLLILIWIGTFVYIFMTEEGFP